MKRAESVILLTPGFPDGEDDTTCLPFLQDFVLSFDKVYPGIKLYVLSFQYPFIRGEYTWNGKQIFCAGGKNKKGVFRLFTWFRIFQQFRLIYKSTKVKGILCLWLTECALVGRWLGKWYKVKQLTYLLGQDVSEANRYLKLLPLSQMKTIALSPQMAGKYLKIIGNTATAVIPFGVSEERFKMADSSVKTIDVLGVGSLIPLKNFEVFVKTIARLQKDFPEIKAVLIGGGPESDKLRKLAEDMKLGNCLTFTGELANSKVIDYMSRSKILLHPSFTEGQGLVFTEAIACGMRIVCFDVGRFEIQGRFFIAENDEELYMRAKEQLDDNSEVPPLISKSMKETVNECMELLFKED